MCVDDIIDCIRESNNCSNNTGYLVFTCNSELKHFSQNLVNSLINHFKYDETFQIISSSKYTVKAVIFGRTYIIDLFGDELFDNIRWNITIV